MAELTLVAYVLSLLSIIVNIWLVFEIKEMKEERKRDMIRKRLNNISKSIQPNRPKGYWG